MLQYNFSRIPGKRSHELFLIRWINAKFLFFGASVLILLGSFVYIYSAYVFSAKKPAEVDSWQFAFLISEFMHQIPTLKPINPKQYHYRFFYDSDLAKNILTYRSKATTSEVISYYQLYFGATDYRFVNMPVDSVAIFKNGNKNMEVYVKDHQDYRHVTINYYPSAQ